MIRLESDPQIFVSQTEKRRCSDGEQRLYPPRVWMEAGRRKSRPLELFITVRTMVVMPSATGYAPSTVISK